MSLSRYPEYKPSGIEWLPEVPSHWIVKRVRHAANLNPSKREVHHLPRDLQVDFLPMEAVGTDGRINRQQKRPIEAVIDGFTYFREGDVAFAKITPCFENGKCAIMRGLAEGIGFGTTELTVLRPHPAQTVSEYFFYLLSSEPFRVLGESEMYGAGGQKRIPEEFVRNFRIAFPPVDEQKRIAEFLDHETAKIDALIEEQQRLIELLEEKRQAVISHAVTKGLDPDAPMKDSGFGWIGDIPENWSAAKIRFLAKLESGHTPSRSRPEYWQDCTVPWFTLADIWQVRQIGRKNIYETKEQVSHVGLANSSARILPENTVALSRTASVGFPAILARPMATSQDFACWICGSRLLPEFLYYALVAMRGHLQSLMIGSTHKTIYMPDIAELVCPLPSVGEQQRICRHVVDETDSIDSAISSANKLISLLRERRSALISAAVTGKIDVRNWKPRVESAEDVPIAAEESAIYETSEP